jgi:hypothetical protein
VHLTRDDFSAMFETFARSAFRLEVHQVYTMPREQPNIALFLAGERKPENHNSAWHDLIRANIAAGKTMIRAKVVRWPLTDYLRYQFAWSVPGNVDAGEDYRIIDVTDRDVDLPDQDFWMFDESKVVLMNYNSDGTMRGHELVESEDVNKYCRWRDAALKESVRFSEYRAGAAGRQQEESG